MKLDESKFHLKVKLMEYDIHYAVYEEEGFNQNLTFEEVKEKIDSEEIKGNTNTDNQICFASFKHMAKDKVNRVLFKVNFKHAKDKKLHLTEHEKNKWVSLCRYHGLMPSYVGKHFLTTGSFIVRFDDLTSSKIYMMLTAARYMQEYPETVRATVYLREKGLNFFLALLFASRLTIQNTGHSIYRNAAKSYCEDTNIYTTTAYPKEALALLKYIREEHESKENQLHRLMAANCSAYQKDFMLQSCIASVNNKINEPLLNCGYKLEDLFSDKIQNIFRKFKPKVQK